MARIAWYVAPTSTLFIVVGDVIVRAIFEHGSFTSADTVAVWLTLAFLSTGLLVTAAPPAAERVVRPRRRPHAGPPRGHRRGAVGGDRRGAHVPARPAGGGRRRDRGLGRHHGLRAAAGRRPGARSGSPSASWAWPSAPPSPTGSSTGCSPGRWPGGWGAPTWPGGGWGRSPWAARRPRWRGWRSWCSAGCPRSCAALVWGRPALAYVAITYRQEVRRPGPPSPASRAWRPRAPLDGSAAVVGPSRWE